MIWIWAGFILLVLPMLVQNLGVFHRHAHVVSIREALGWSAVWISLGLAFGVFVYFGCEHHWMGLGLAAGITGCSTSSAIPARDGRQDARHQGAQRPGSKPRRPMA
jgi:hypothetical protein